MKKIKFLLYLILAVLFLILAAFDLRDAYRQDRDYWKAKVTIAGAGADSIQHLQEGKGK